MMGRWPLSALTICFVSDSEDEFYLKSPISQPHRNPEKEIGLSYLLTYFFRNIRYKYRI